MAETAVQENGQETKKRVRRQPGKVIFQLSEEKEAKETLAAIPETDGGAGFNLYKVSQGDKACLVIATSPADSIGKAGTQFLGVQSENLTGSRGFALTPEKAEAFIKSLPDEQRQQILKSLMGKTAEPVKTQQPVKKR